jgi:phage shock protein PspC (stress-responsive transcriptional regulator)
MNTTTTRLTRNLDEAMLGGVLAGIANRYNWDPTLLRIVAALVALATGVVPAVLIYIVAWVLIPRSQSAPVAAAPALESSDSAPVGESTSPANVAPPPIIDEMADALRDAADRLGEAATIAAEAARRAATEIGDVARRPRATEHAPIADAPAPSEPTDTATAMSAEVTLEDSEPTEAALDDPIDESSVDQPMSDGTPLDEAPEASPADDNADDDSSADPGRNPSA